MNKNRISHLISIAVLPFLLSACGKVHGERETAPVGVLPANQIRAGIPERRFHDAILSFTQDKTPAACANGKAQYVSRGTEYRGARILAQCADNRCIMVQAYYLDNPIPKEQALAMLKDLMPDDPELLSKIEVGDFQADGKPVKAEVYEYGTRQSGCLIFAEGSSNSVTMVNASTLKPQELIAWFSLKMKAPAATATLATKTSGKSSSH